MSKITPDREKIIPEARGSGQGIGYVKREFEAEKKEFKGILDKYQEIYTELKWVKKSNMNNYNNITDDILKTKKNILTSANRMQNWLLHINDSDITNREILNLYNNAI
jgi:hypothetical protein